MLGGVLAVVIVTVVLIVMAARDADRKRAERALRSAPRATVATLTEGTTARLAGVVTSDGTLKAPLTGRACVAYVVVLEERVGKRGWVRRLHEVRGVPFTLDDGTGRALIDPAQSTMLLEMDASQRSGAFDDATPVEEAFLARHGLTSTGWFLNKTLRYTEGVIEPGERVAVLGRGVREPDPEALPRDALYRSALPTLINIGGTPEHPIVVSDRADLVA